MKQDIAVIGVGNELMGDDAIGPHIVKELMARQVLPEEVLLIDEGRGGMRLVHHIREMEKVLIIDAADIGKDPGEFTVFRPEEVESIKDLSGTNIHEWDLLKMLELSKMMGECPEDVLILAIQPDDLEWGKSISSILMARVEDYIDKVKDIIMNNSDLSS
jgi:hydrogenase maturation protease